MARLNDAKRAEVEDLKELCLVLLDFFGSMDPRFDGVFGDSARSSVEAAAERGHLAGLRMAKNDLIAMIEDVPAQKRANLNRTLLTALGSSLRELLATQLAQIHRIVERGRINTEVEYYLVREQLDTVGDAVLSVDETAVLETLIVAYEDRVASARRRHQLATIYVALLAEGTQVWRPVQARVEGEDLYRIVPASTPDGEEWEFPPGAVVRCERRRLSDDSTESLVAVAQVA